ncbi:MAG: RnfABCDGE type electron transport complex subunit D [Tissierellia bacterium]|nr:RnfABCDGE type electron transport complex subunit D [Tissierellia bacterium]
MKQKMMHPLLVFLALILLVATFFYGWRVLVLTGINILVAVIVEYLCETKIFKRKKISEAAIVTAILYSLTLPVSLPIWISVVGIIVAIFFGKMVFGGFGKNIFNPALVGRAFIYVNFPQPMTIEWNQIMTGFPGGFAHYISPHIDEVSTATPMLLFRNAGEITALKNLLWGNVTGVMGEAPKIIILIAAVYLIYKKIASWEIMAGSVLGFTTISLVFTMQGVNSVPNPLYGMLMGGFLFGTVFMATDPISAAKTPLGKWIYGIIIGIITVVIRGFALFSGGMMFAILIGNMFAPIIDYGIRKQKQKKKVKKEVTNV